MKKTFFSLLSKDSNRDLYSRIISKIAVLVLKLTRSEVGCDDISELLDVFLFEYPDDENPDSLQNIIVLNKGYIV